MPTLPGCDRERLDHLRVQQNQSMAMRRLLPRLRMEGCAEALRLGGINGWRRERGPGYGFPLVLWPRFENGPLNLKANVVRLFMPLTLERRAWRFRGLV